MSLEVIPEVEEFPTRIYRGRTIGNYISAAVMLSFVAAFGAFCLVQLYYSLEAGHGIAASVAGFWSVLLLFVCWRLFRRIRRAMQQTLTLNRDSFTITQGTDTKTFDQNNIIAIDCPGWFGGDLQVHSLDGTGVIDFTLFGINDGHIITTYFRTKFAPHMRRNRDLFLGKPSLIFGIVFFCFVLLFIIGSRALFDWDRGVEIDQVMKDARLFAIFNSIFLFNFVRNHFKQSPPTPAT